MPIFISWVGIALLSLWEEMKTWQVVANTAVIGDRVDITLRREGNLIFPLFLLYKI